MRETWVWSLGWEDATQVFLPGEFHGLFSPWGRKESDTTEQLSLILDFILPLLIVKETSATRW